MATANPLTIKKREEQMKKLRKRLGMKLHKKTYKQYLEEASKKGDVDAKSYLKNKSKIVWHERKKTED